MLILNFTHAKQDETGIILSKSQQENDH